MSQETETVDNGKYNISFNYYGNKIRVYKQLIDVLGNPKYIQFLINTEDLLLYVRGTDKHDSNCLEVPKFNGKKKFCYELHGRYFIKKISSLAGWTLGGLYVIQGKYLEQYNLIAFNLREAVRKVSD